MLLAAVARGDETAFGRLYDLVAPRVYGLVRRVLRDPAQAEEVAQEILVEVWRTAARWDAGRGSATAWIFMITHRRAVDRVRAEQAASERRPGPVRRRWTRRTTRWPTRWRCGWSVSRCGAAWTMLTVLQREAVTLAFYQGHAYPQVSELLRVPLPTVKSRMRDGLTRLRDCLSPEVAA